jgi:hypothetical protein
VFLNEPARVQVVDIEAGELRAESLAQVGLGSFRDPPELSQARPVRAAIVGGSCGPKATSASTARISSSGRDRSNTGISIGKTAGAALLEGGPLPRLCRADGLVSSRGDFPSGLVDQASVRFSHVRREPVGLVVELPSAGDDAQPGVADGAVDLPGGEAVLAVLVDGVDAEDGHGPVGAGDLDLVTRPQCAEAEKA